jgi:hypothetical protein
MSTLILNPGSQHRQDSGIFQASRKTTSTPHMLHAGKTVRNWFGRCVVVLRFPGRGFS